MVCAIGGLPKCAKFGCSGDTFDSFNTKVWSVDDIIIVIYINGVLVTVNFDDSFNTKVLSVQHINIVMFINGVWYRGSSVM